MIFFKTCIVLLLIFSSILPAHSQDDPGDDPDAPLDGGLSLLMAGCIGYGIKKAYDAGRKNKNDLPGDRS